MGIVRQRDKRSGITYCELPEILTLKTGRTPTRLSP